MCYTYAHIKDKGNARHERQKEKVTKNMQLRSDKKIQSQNKLFMLKAQREHIIDNSTLTDAERAKRLNQINKKIESAQKELQRKMSLEKSTELKGTMIDENKKVDRMQDILRAREKTDKKLTKSEEKSLEEIEYKKNLLEKEKKKTEKEKQEMEEMKNLLEIPPSELTSEQKELLNKLKAKFLKNKSRTNTADLDEVYGKIHGKEKEITNIDKEISRIDQEYESRQAEINALQAERKKNHDDDAELIESAEKELKEQEKLAKRTKQGKEPLEDFTFLDLKEYNTSMGETDKDSIPTEKQGEFSTKKEPEDNTLTENSEKKENKENPDLENFTLKEEPTPPVEKNNSTQKVDNDAHGPSPFIKNIVDKFTKKNDRTK